MFRIDVLIEINSLIIWSKTLRMFEEDTKKWWREQIHSNMFDQFIKTSMNNAPIFKHLDNTLHSDDDNTRTVSHDHDISLFEL